MSAYCKNLKICGGDAFGDSVRSVYIEDLTQWLNMDGDLWLYSTEGFVNYYVNGKELENLGKTFFGFVLFFYLKISFFYTKICLYIHKKRDYNKTRNCNYQKGDISVYKEKENSYYSGSNSDTCYYIRLF